MRNESALETPPAPVSVEIDGRTYTGTYRTGRGFVMLTSELGSCFAQRGRMEAGKVAALLLRKLAERNGTIVG